MTTVPKNRQSIYLIAAHPHWRESCVTRRLMTAADAARAAGAQIDINDLYATYPDYAIDAEAERERVEAADLLVLVHPIQWYSMPALQKLWLDEVLGYGWAYGAGGDALRGKDLWLVASTGGPEASYHPQGYNRYFFDAFLPPLILHGARSTDRASLEAHADTFAERLASYPDWPEMDELVVCATCVVPAQDRPETAPVEAPAS